MLADLVYLLCACLYVLGSVWCQALSFTGRQRVGLCSSAYVLKEAYVFRDRIQDAEVVNN